MVLWNMLSQSPPTHNMFSSPIPLWRPSTRLQGSSQRKARLKNKTRCKQQAQSSLAIATHTHIYTYIFICTEISVWVVGTQFGRILRTRTNFSFRLFLVSMAQSWLGSLFAPTSPCTCTPATLKQTGILTFSLVHVQLWNHFQTASIYYRTSTSMNF